MNPSQSSNTASEDRVETASKTVKVDAQSPWPGAEAYDEASRAFFYGRTQESADLMRLVRLAPLTVVYGKSGLGKTSLLQAGLFPLLREQHHLPVLKRMDFERVTLDTPLEQMKQELKKSLELAGADFPAMERGETLWEYLHRKDGKIWTRDNFPLTPVLVFDQFEELFSRTSGKAELIKHVFDELADLIENRIPAELGNDDASAKRSQLDLLSERYRVVLSFREDFLPTIRTWERQVPSLLRNYLRLEPMSRERAIEAVKQAGKAVLEGGDKPDSEVLNDIASAIVDLVGKGDQEKVANDTSDVVIEPVLLSLCCTQLNERRKQNKDGKRIDRKLVADAGQDILESFYRTALEDPAVRGHPSAAVFIEENLIQGERYRGDYPKEEALNDGLLRPEQLAALTDKHRLLRIINRGDTPRIELIHDRLVPVVREARDERRLHARQKEQEEKARAAELERDRERARSEQLDRQAKRLRRYFRVVALLAIAAALAAGFAFLEMNRAAKAERDAIAQKTEADRQKGVADRKTIDAQQAKSKADAEAARADSSAKVARSEATLAGEARRIAERALAQAKESHQSKDVAVKASLFAEGRIAFQAKSEPLEQAMYRALATYRLSKNHSMEAARDPSLSALETVLDTSGHLAKVIRKPGIMPTPALAYSPDGKIVAVGSEDGLIWLLKVDDYQKTGPPLDCQREVKGQQEGERQQGGKLESPWTIAFNKTGTRLAVGYASPDEANLGREIVCVFDIERRTILRKWSSPQQRKGPVGVAGVAYGGGRDKEFVIFGGTDKKVRRLEVATGNIAESDAGDQEIGTVAMDAKETRVAAGGDDKIVRIWKIDDIGSANKEPDVMPQGHEATINQIVFSPFDSRILVSAGNDGRIIAWNIDDRCVTEQSKQQDAIIFGITIQSQGVIAAAGGDGYVRLFSLSQKRISCAKQKTAESPAKGSEIPELAAVKEGVLSGHGGFILAVAFDQEGDHLASAGQDGSIRVWMPDTGSFSLAELDSGSSGKVTAVAISASGEWVAAGFDNGNIAVWKGPEGKATPRVHDNEPKVQGAVARWKAHEKAIRGLLFASTRDGLVVISAADDGLIRMWDVASQRLIKPEMADGTDKIASIALSPDGKTLAAGSYDGTVRLWNIETGKGGLKIEPPDSEPEYELSSVGFTRDGRYLAIGSSWYSDLRVVDLKNAGKPWALRGHNRGISHISHGEREWLESSDRNGSVLEWEKQALEENSLAGASSSSLRKRDEFKLRHGVSEVRPTQPITSMDTSREGDLILTGGDGGQIQLWDGEGHVLISDHFSGHGVSKIEAVALAPDGSFFVTADSTRILVWPGPDRWADILCDKLQWNMSQGQWNKWVSKDLQYTYQCQNPRLTMWPEEEVKASQ